jgi:hypothetical protein
MKAALMTALCIGSLYAQTGGMVNFGSGPNIGKEVQADESRTSSSAVMQAAAASSEGSSKHTGNSEIMIINPIERAKDYKEVYTYLKTQKSAGKVTFTMRDGSMLSNISEIVLPNNGSMLVFRLNTTQGVKYKVVKVEDITSVEQL